MAIRRSNAIAIGSLWLWSMLSPQSWANVVYNWQTVGTAGFAGTFAGQFEVSDDAWRAGVMQYQYDPACPLWKSSCGPVQNADPTSPIRQITFSGASQTVTESLLANFADRGLPLSNGAPNAFALELGDFASGSFEVNTGDTTLLMASTGNLWTISYFDSDDGGQLCPPQSQTRCAGVTGYWVLDRSTIPVSAPSTLALCCAALFGVAAARRPRGLRLA